MQRKVPIIVLFADMQEKETDSILAWFTKLAEANIDTLAFVYAEYVGHRPILNKLWFTLLLLIQQGFPFSLAIARCQWKHGPNDW